MIGSRVRRMGAGLLGTFLVATATGEVPVPEVVHVGLVAPEIVQVTVHDGYARTATQEPYAAQEGDWVDTSGFPHRILYRKELPTGVLAGKDQSVLLPYDTFVPGILKPEALQHPDSYSLVAAGGAQVRPVTVHRKTRPRNMVRTGPWQFQSVPEHALFLMFEEPLREGVGVTLTFPGLGLAPVAFTPAARALRSEAVHVSHLGFHPDETAKVAFLSCWAGDGGGVTYPEGMPFEVIDTRTGAVAFEGTWTLAKAAEDTAEDAYNRNYNLTDVWMADFTALRATGTHVVSVPGIGCSYSFEIGEGVWDEPLRVSARGLFHQRSGVDLGPPHTPFVRPRGFHPDDGLEVFASTAALIDTGNGPLGYDVDPTNFGKLNKGRTDTRVEGVWGGYHDAGDWDRRIQHLVSTRNLLDLVDFFPEHANAFDLNIPESGNALPDLLDEAIFGLEVYRRLQTPDGGVRGGIESEEHPRYGETSWQESLTVMAYEPDPWSTWWYAGTAARAARVLERHDAAAAAGWRDSALKAMAWAEATVEGQREPLSIMGRILRRTGITALVVVLLAWGLARPPGFVRGRMRLVTRVACLLALPLTVWGCFAAVSATGYPVDLRKAHLLRDARNYAAAELFRLTGDAAWQDTFRGTLVLGKEGAHVSEWGSHDQAEAAWVYCLIPEDLADPELRKTCLNAIVRTADERLEGIERAGFRWAKHTWRPFGIGVPAAPDGASLIHAHRLTGNDKYLRGVVLAVQYGGGANPMNLCMTTGLGHRSPLHPMHLDSRLSGQPAPEGITVLGGMDVSQAWFDGDWGRKLLAPHTHPELTSWPPAETYMDVFWNALLCEFTIHDSLAPVVYFRGYLAGIHGKKATESADSTPAGS